MEARSPRHVATGLAPTKICNLCQKNLCHRITIGPKAFPFWTHVGEELEACQALGHNQYYAQRMMRLLERVGKTRDGVRVVRVEDGTPQIFGEHDERKL